MYPTLAVRTIERLSMPVIDFKEIPEAHLTSGMQDTFELFARDFLKYLGYEIAEDPSRGADGGKDLIVIERRKGIGGETSVKWLVSCKHKAHSGSSVNPDVEKNIRDRIESNHCNGFIGFYSTLASSGLNNMIQGLSSKHEVQIFDREKIESELLNHPDGWHLARRFFPKSMDRWNTENPKPAKIFHPPPTLCCDHCGKDLLDPKPEGIIVMWYSYKETNKHVQRIYWSCKGSCDEQLKKLTRLEFNRNLIDGWEDIPDIASPFLFIRWVMSSLNELKNGDTYSPEAFGKLKMFILSIYPHVVRKPTQKELERLDIYRQLPPWAGGLG